MKERLHIDKYGNKRWYYRDTDMYHREDGPAIEFANGDKIWYRYGLIHREDGPALEWASGGREWWRLDKHHRIDGPAIIYKNGVKRWYYYGERIHCSSQREFERLIKLRAFW